MCNLKQEEFLSIRFKENEAEMQCLEEANKLMPDNIIIQTMLKIAQTKRGIYQDHLDCEVEQQKDDFKDDETLTKLRDALEAFQTGKITHSQYWMRVDTLLYSSPKDRKYILINNQWVRNINE